MDPVTYVAALVLVFLAWKVLGAKTKPDELDRIPAHVHMHG